MTDFADFWKKQQDIIETHGWALTSVLSDGTMPSYTYSVGLSAKGLPELLLVGVGPRDAQIILNAAAKKLIGGVFSGAPGERLQEVANFPLAPRHLAQDLAEKFALGADRYAHENNLKMHMIQIVFPDQKGLFPWEAGCDPSMTAMQKLGEDAWLDAPEDGDIQRPGSPETLH